MHMFDEKLTFHTCKGIKVKKKITFLKSVDYNLYFKLLNPLKTIIDDRSQINAQ